MNDLLCKTEDSINCVWLGFAQGNGQGATVINFTDSWIVLDNFNLLGLAIVTLGITAALALSVIERVKRA
jgi:hypothetical protein